MNKSYNIRKRKYIKRDGKQRKSCYDYIHSKCPLQKPVRTYVKSYLNKYIKDRDIIENFIYPLKLNNTYTWYDGIIFKPKVYKLYD